MSSLFTSGQPATRLFLCAAGRIKPSQHSSLLSAPTSIIILPRSNRATRRRQYAVKISPLRPLPAQPSPPPPPPPTTTSTRGVEREPPRWIFSPSDVPPLPEWIHGLEGLGKTDLTPMQCVEAAQRYVSTATQNESSWRPRLEEDYGLSPYLLHWLGIVLISGNTPPRWKLGTHMLRSASELGHGPSTLTLMRLFATMAGQKKENGKIAGYRIFTDVEARFRQLVDAGEDPDALTLQGLILANSGAKDRNRRALEAFERAEKAWEARAANARGASKGADVAAAAAPPPPHSSSSNGGAGEASGLVDEVTLPEPREPRWEWEVSCVLGRAGILRAHDRPGEALALYRVAALELDNPTGFWSLAQLMGGPPGSPERRTYLLKAATSGVTDACRELGGLERAAAAAAVSRAEREHHENMSQEWFRLADGDELKSIQDEAMSDD